MLFEYDKFTNDDESNFLVSEASCLGFKAGQPLPEFFKVQKDDVVSEYQHRFTKRSNDSVRWWDYVEVNAVFDKPIRIFND